MSDSAPTPAKVYGKLGFDKQDELSMKFTMVRDQISRWFTIVAISLLLAAALCICLAWIFAARDGSIPEQWGAYEGNHGPWRHYYPGRDLIGTAVMLPMMACLASTIGCLFRISRRSLLALFISPIVFFAVLLTHSWLVD